MTVANDVALISAANQTLAIDKNALTEVLTTYVEEFNALAQQVWGGATQAQVETALLQMTDTLTKYVQQFDLVTADDATLQEAISATVADLIITPFVDVPDISSAVAGDILSNMREYWMNAGSVQTVCLSQMSAVDAKVTTAKWHEDMDNWIDDPTLINAWTFGDLSIVALQQGFWNYENATAEPQAATSPAITQPATT